MKLKQLAKFITEKDAKKINKLLRDLKNQDNIQELFKMYEDNLNKLFKNKPGTHIVNTSCPTCRAKVITKIKHIMHLRSNVIA